MSRPTISGGELASTKWSEDSAEKWLTRSATSGRLQEMQTAWRFAAAAVGSEPPVPDVVIDIASGSGRFLEVMLDRFPDTRGIWSDPFETMLAEAKFTLGRFGDRIEYRPADLAELASIVSLRGRCRDDLTRAGLSASNAIRRVSTAGETDPVSSPEFDPL